MATHIATAAQAPDNLGTNDPSQIDLITLNNPTTTLVENDEQNINPYNFRLYHNYPNPFNSQTTISYQLFKPANVKIDIYNINGSPVRHLVDGYQNSGYYRNLWDDKTSTGIFAASGTYLCKIKAIKTFILSECNY